MSNRGYSRFHNLNIVGCLRKKRLIKPYKGGGGGGRGAATLFKVFPKLFHWK